MTVYDKPMIYYPLSTPDACRHSGGALLFQRRDLPVFEELLGDGSQLGMKFSYKVQESRAALRMHLSSVKNSLGTIMSAWC